jgi:hypothetical protein
VSKQFTAIAPSNSNKRSQLFIGAHKKTLSTVAVRVSNPDRLPVRIKS